MLSVLDSLVVQVLQVAQLLAAHCMKLYSAYVTTLLFCTCQLEEEKSQQIFQAMLHSERWVAVL